MKALFLSLISKGGITNNINDVLLINDSKKSKKFYYMFI